MRLCSSLQRNSPRKRIIRRPCRDVQKHERVTWRHRGMRSDRSQLHCGWGWHFKALEQVTGLRQPGNFHGKRTSTSARPAGTAIFRPNCLVSFYAPVSDFQFAHAVPTNAGVAASLDVCSRRFERVVRAGSVPPSASRCLRRAPAHGSNPLAKIAASASNSYAPISVDVPITRG